MRDGAVVADFIAQLASFDRELESAGTALSSIRVNLAAAVSTLRDATKRVAAADTIDRLAGAGPYLRLFGIVTGGWLMARQALAATRKLQAGSPEGDFLEAKVVTANFYCEQILPQASGLLPAATASANDLMALSAEQF
jgi:hypothetical protein